MDEETASEQVVKISIWTPLLYVGVLMTSFIVFSILYRRRKAQSLSKIEPIFPENHTHSLYLFLKQQYNNPEATKESRPHEKVMKAALLRRGVEAIRRSLKLKEIEPTFNKLYQEGLIGDEVFKNFQFQAKFQEMDLKDIVQECETYKKGWVNLFFPVAQEICFNEALRRRLASMDERSKTLSIQWQYFVEKSEAEPSAPVEEKKKSAIENKKERNDDVAESKPE